MEWTPNRWMFFYRALHDQPAGRRTKRRDRVQHELAARYDGHVCEIVKEKAGNSTIVEFEDGTQLVAYQGELCGT